MLSHFFGFVNILLGNCVIQLRRYSNSTSARLMFITMDNRITRERQRVASGYHYSRGRYRAVTNLQMGQAWREYEPHIIKTFECILYKTNVVLSWWSANETKSQLSNLQLMVNTLGLTATKSIVFICFLQSTKQLYEIAIKLFTGKIDLAM